MKTASKPQRRTPKLRRHRASGQALTVIDGRHVYLGKHGTEEATAAYHRLMAEWMSRQPGAAARERAALVVDRAEQRAAALDPDRAARRGVTITELCAAYWIFATGYYAVPNQPGEGKHSREANNIKLALAAVRKLYGATPAAAFGPRKLRTVRDHLESESGWSRKHVNAQLARIRRAFKWAVAEELVSVGVFEALRTVPGLKRGRTTATERAPVKPVPEADILATLKHLPPPVAAAVEVQWLTGARPGEVLDLHTEDIERAGDVWTWRPQSHKNAHRGHDRVIPVGPRAQAILRPLLRLDGDYLFRPADARTDERQTKEWPSHLRAKEQRRAERRAAGRRKLGERYSTASYGRAIARACELAEVQKWTPHRLRHSRATDVRHAYGLEAAATVLGHKALSVTEIYAERDLALARKVAAETG